MRLLHTPLEAAAWLKASQARTLQSDSRKLQPGDAFVAWPGAATDARSHVTEALAQGVVACLVEQDGAQQFGWSNARVATYATLRKDIGPIAAEFFGNPSEALAVVAVTGTNGKTSTAWWLAQALSGLPAGLAMPCGVVGTLGVGRPPAIGPTTPLVAATMLETGLTTPDPVLLQKTLRDFVATGVTACAMEASSIGVETHRMDGTQVRVAVFTNFTQDHLDYHGTMDAYWAAKRKLFAWPGLRHAVINVDDAHGAGLAESLGAGALDVWTVSCQVAARLQALGIVYGEHGLQFQIKEGSQVVQVHTRMIGQYNVANLLGVVAAMRCLGVPLADAVAVCEYLQPVPGRMECVGGVEAPLVAVDYAHTPDALGKALCALKPLVRQRGGKLWCVFGCGGDRDAAKRPMMGALAAQHADCVVVTSDNPRSEKPEAIVAQILLGIAQSDSVQVQVDRAQAIAQAIAGAAANDVILLAGKGHEVTQEVAGTKHPFSDRIHALAALDRRSALGQGAAA